MRSLRRPYAVRRMHEGPVARPSAPLAPPVRYDFFTAARPLTPCM
jgi:hypothetical protein